MNPAKNLGWGDAGARIHRGCAEGGAELGRARGMGLGLAMAVATSS